MNILINGRLRIIPESISKISYEDIVRLSGNTPYDTYTVTYSSTTNDGSLTLGESVDLTEGMIFNIFLTNNG